MKSKQKFLALALGVAALSMGSLAKNANACYFKPEAPNDCSQANETVSPSITVYSNFGYTPGPYVHQTFLQSVLTTMDNFAVKVGESVMPLGWYSSHNDMTYVVPNQLNTCIEMPNLVTPLFDHCYIKLANDPTHPLYEAGLCDTHSECNATK